MPLLVNLRHLATRDLEFQGELSVGELDLNLRDDMIRAEEPLTYHIEVHKLENALLLQGRLRLSLRCQCVRCLKPFEQVLRLDRWTRHLPLEGEEKVPVVNDCVDLTAHLREDILLEFPQHPLCGADCHGLPEEYGGKENKTSDTGFTGQQSSAWAELDKLKL